MPIHDWSRVDAGVFHDFHLAWVVEIANALNRYQPVLRVGKKENIFRIDSDDDDDVHHDVH